MPEGDRVAVSQPINGMLIIVLGAADTDGMAVYAAVSAATAVTVK